MDLRMTEVTRRKRECTAHRRFMDDKTLLKSITHFRKTRNRAK